MRMKHVLPSCGPTHKMNSNHRMLLLHHMLHHYSFSRSGHPIGALSGLTGLLPSCNQICTPAHSERQCLHTIRIPRYIFSVWGEKRPRWRRCLQSSMIPKWEVSNPIRFYRLFRANYLVVRAVGVTYSTATFRSTCPICWECTRSKSRHSKRLVVQRLRMGLAPMLRKGLSIDFHSWSDFSFDSLSLIATGLSAHTLAVKGLLGIAFPLMVFEMEIDVGVSGS